MASTTANDYESDVDYSETECSYDDYYNLYEDSSSSSESINQMTCDLEYFEFDCLTVDQVSWAFGFLLHQTYS